MNHDREGDSTLVDRLARAGDARAFETLYARHTPSLFATAVRLTRDRDAAADVVHDAWVRAVETLARFEKRSTFRTWITGILINRTREVERERQRDSHGRRDGELEDIDVVDPASISPLDASRFDRLDLEMAIAALPLGFRHVLVLHDVEGFTHDEIAEMLGLVPGTSKSQLSRARRRVREMLETGIPREVPR